MRFYKVTENAQITLFYKINKGDIYCNSFYFGWVKCATNKRKTEHYINHQFKPLDFIEVGLLKPLDKYDLIKLQHHLKKEMLLFDFPFSLKNDEIKTIDMMENIKDRVKKYKNRKHE